MKQRRILIGYLVFFFAVVSTYDLYAENTYLVALAAITLMVAGLAAWIWSVQPGPGDKESDQDKN